MFHCFRYSKVQSSYGNQFPSLAWEFNVDPVGEVIAFRVARCSEKDNFSREIAKDILDQRDWIFSPYDKEEPLVVNAIETLKGLIEGGPTYFSNRNEYQMAKRVVNDYERITLANAELLGIRYHFPNFNPYFNINN